LIGAARRHQAVMRRRAFDIKSDIRRRIFDLSGRDKLILPPANAAQPRFYPISGTAPP
jgi:hypothetical protein